MGLGSKLKKAAKSVSRQVARTAEQGGAFVQKATVASLVKPTEIAGQAAGGVLGAAAPVVGQAFGVLRQNPELATLAGTAFGGPLGGLLGSAFGGSGASAGSGGATLPPSSALAASAPTNWWRIGAIAAGAAVVLGLVVFIARRK